MPAKPTQLLTVRDNNSNTDNRRHHNIQAQLRCLVRYCCLFFHSFHCISPKNSLPSLARRKKIYKQTHTHTHTPSLYATCIRTYIHADIGLCEDILGRAAIFYCNRRMHRQVTTCKAYIFYSSPHTITFHFSHSMYWYPFVRSSVQLSPCFTPCFICFLACLLACLPTCLPASLCPFVRRLLSLLHHHSLLFCLCARVSLSLSLSLCLSVNPSACFLALASTAERAWLCIGAERSCCYSTHISMSIRGYILSLSSPPLNSHTHAHLCFKSATPDPTAHSFQTARASSSSFFFHPAGTMSGLQHRPGQLGSGRAFIHSFIHSFINSINQSRTTRE